MKWKLIEAREFGMLVADSSGRQYLVDWEQKATLVAANVLAVRAQDDDPEPSVFLLAGEVEGVDSDTEVGACVRDADLLRLWAASQP